MANSVSYSRIKADEGARLGQGSRPEPRREDISAISLVTGDSWKGGIEFGKVNKSKSDSKEECHADHRIGGDSRPSQGKNLPGGESILLDYGTTTG
jgi:hypothetical protein